MRIRLLAALAMSLLGASAPLAFDDATQAIIDRHKANKPMAISAIATLMGASERWCYLEQEGTCAWSDIYLEVTDDGSTFEIANAWSADVDIAFTDIGVFRDDRYICETGDDWVETVRGFERGSGDPIGGRPLWTLKQEVETVIAGGTIDCFDYLFLAADADRQTVTLLQRQYTDDAYNPSNDAEVTLHFNAKTAAALTSRW